ncbi:hypothetical protein SDC9_123709 [bioreactor metagenome]|uniref:TetR/AcrR type transcriptional regulator-like C-terminal domain-containing protein n=1 Tax=bioreactor metagenome TaxID=1076179 RepID=A0A645CIE8_9ZZZZ
MVDSNVLNCLHKGENALLHQKILSRVIENMTPVLVNIIKEGIQKGIFSCRYTEQYMQIFLAASLTLTDEGIFESDADFQLKIMTALISVLEMMLCVPENSFMQMFNKLQNR